MCKNKVAYDLYQSDKDAYLEKVRECTKELREDPYGEKETERLVSEEIMRLGPIFAGDYRECQSETEAEPEEEERHPTRCEPERVLI